MPCLTTDLAAIALGFPARHVPVAADPCGVQATAVCLPSERRGIYPHELRSFFEGHFDRGSRHGSSYASVYTLAHHSGTGRGRAA